MGSLLHDLTRLGPDAVDARAFRVAALERLREAVPADAAGWHALSPRVGLEHGVWLGLDLPAEAGPSRWDALAVELAPLREAALQRGGVVADTEVVPRTGPLRRRYAQAVVRPTGMRHLALLHLVVRDRIRAVILLGRRHERFHEPELSVLREVVPVLAVADTLHQALDDVPQAPLSTGSTCVDPRLTPRQREMVGLVAQGLTNPQIGAALGLSTNTVRNRLADAFRRLDVGSRAELVRVAVRR